ncbi:MAG TPA: tetratricopeptide repeat protein [Gemmatimonadales bacterium]|nr:tetratricopeptide repeat protein [Gemmatimonadales bacterium]
MRAVVRKPAVVTLSVGLLLAAGWLGTAAWAGERRRAPLRDEARIRDLDIGFFERRLARDPSSAYDLARLAALHLQRGREHGNPTDVVRAEQLARTSLASRATRNAKGYSTLVATLMTEHRFIEARAAAQRLLALDSTSVPSRATLAEIEMELGDYDAARVMFGALYTQRASVAVAPRLARWLELQGQVEEARRLLTAALDSARANPRMPREQLAWFHLRVGDLELREGQPGSAARAYRAGLAVSPHDARLLAALARVARARGQWRQAIRYGEQSIAIAPDPATLGLIGDAYTAIGDSAQAGEYVRAMEAVTFAQPGGFHRAWSLFLLDHGLRVPDVLAQVQAEIRTRPDIYGWDLLAWALHRSGRDRDALPAMARALSLGTRDAMLYTHMAVIERGLGHRVAAQQYFGQAHDTDPYCPCPSS